MKRLLPILCLLACAACAPQPAATSALDWSEPADPQGERPEAWAAAEKPVVTFGSTDIRYPRTVPFEGDLCEETALAGWRGEKVSAQVVVSAPEAVEGLRR